MPSNRDIQIPGESIIALRRSLVRQSGVEAAARALQEAGHAAGDALHERLRRTADQELDGVPSATFWDRLNGLFRELGWGSVEHQELHPGVGALVARDWFEAAGAARPNAWFTTGVLANILGHVAGQEVAVLQVECPDRTPGCCRFLFGAGAVLQEVYEGLSQGEDVDATIGALG